MVACSGGPGKGPSGFNTSSPLGARVGGIRLGQPTWAQWHDQQASTVPPPLLGSHMAPAMGALSCGSDLRRINSARTRGGRGKPHSLGWVPQEWVRLLTNHQWTVTCGLDCDMCSSSPPKSVCWQIDIVGQYLHNTQICWISLINLKGMRWLFVVDVSSVFGAGQRLVTQTAGAEAD